MGLHKNTICTYPSCKNSTETRKIRERGEDPDQYLCRKHKKFSKTEDSKTKVENKFDKKDGKLKLTNPKLITE